MSVLKSAEFVSKHSNKVKINIEAIEKTASILLPKFESNAYDISAWKKHPLHPKAMSKETLDWIFLIDLLNFSFWNSRSNLDPYTVSYNGIEYTGYWSLCAAIRKAVDNAIPITNPSYYSQISVQDFDAIFQTDDPLHQQGIPMANERLDLLQKAGNILETKLGGSFANLIAHAEKSAQKLLKLIIENFGFIFDDSVDFEGRKVHFHKRAQILIADIWACFEGKGFGEFHDIDTITMFADYRVPQGLLYFGILEYSKELLDQLEIHEKYHSEKSNDLQHINDFTLQRGDLAEVEIRANSIYAVHLLAEALRKRTDKISTYGIAAKRKKRP